MHYRSVADLGDTIMQNLHKLPPKIDLVIGEPRSGMLAANLLCLFLNVPLADVDGFLEGRILKTGITRKCRNIVSTFEEMRTVVVIDDSIDSGKSMRETRARLEKISKNIDFIFCAVYGVTEKSPHVDFVFETVPLPHMFQWNVMHHEDLENCCVDIDGVLCMDPTARQNDDGPAYEEFLRGAVPMLVPGARIGMLVTSRLEKYRAQTEAWLRKHNIMYDELRMLDIESREECVRLKAHGPYKADIYARSNAILFIESDYYQAQEIAKQSGKPVLCVASQHIITPSFSVATIKQLPLRLRTAHYRRLRYWVHRLVGDRGYQKLKSLVGGIKSLVRKVLKRGRIDSKPQVEKPETGVSGS